MEPDTPRRNIGILAHIDAGKTSLTERLLYASGRIRSPGAIEAGTTVTDFLAVERERGITVKAAAAHLSWRGARVNLIDTPGHVDFGFEVERSVGALDGAVVLLCAVAGVQSRTEAIYRAIRRRGAARIAFVNKMDRRGASFSRAMADLRRLLDPGALAVHLPWGEGEAFRGFVDLVAWRAVDLGGGVAPVPAELEAEARAARSALSASLAEALAELPDSAAGEALMEDFVAGREIEPPRLSSALRAAAVAGARTPVLCGSAFSDACGAAVLDAAVDWLPSPAEATAPFAQEPSGAEIRLVPEGPFAALVFKTGSDPHVGRLSWARVWSGSVSRGDRVLDARTGRLLRAARLFEIQADSLEKVEEARAGDIVAIALDGPSGAGRGPSRDGPEEASPESGATGSTLCDPRRPLLFETLPLAEPVVSLAIEPKTRADAAGLRAGVAALADEDPSLRWAEDPQTGRIELSGMGELHLEVAVERLARERGARIRAGAPRVAYREVLAGTASAVEDFDRDLGGQRARARVGLRLGPSAGGPAFASELGTKAAPSYLEAARRGVEAALSVGPSAGFPLGGCQAALLELSLPGGLSRADPLSERAVEIAASLAAGKAAREAGSRVCEPVMRIEVTVPSDYLGAAAAAISGRGGRVEAVEEAPDGGSLVVGAAPLRRLFGFAGELRSSSQGRAECQARFSRYEPVPKGFTDLG